MKKIGFANKFYTLWDYESETVYKTDSYGTHHPVSINHKYTYIKNISFDLDKVKEMYPGVDIDENLRGVSTSFTVGNDINLPVDFFWVGKYCGQKIQEVIQKDLGYCVWAAQNMNIPTTVNFIKSTPEYQEYLKKQQEDKQKIFDEAGSLKVGDEVEINFLTNGWMSADYVTCCANAEYGDLSLVVQCKGFRAVNSLYPYIMPQVNGVVQKTKNKTMKVKVVEAEEPFLLFKNKVRQIITIS